MPMLLLRLQCLDDAFVLLVGAYCNLPQKHQLLSGLVLQYGQLGVLFLVLDGVSVDEICLHSNLNITLLLRESS